ncbi:hypothetical protein E2562_000138 [Oryza meyeriana var. granulata]|uniref:Uncharacterized protein n=1 Tax=Oryza meyeriana var. granulata TaxID=110450 RepID=A0A6G1DBS0_9ORYZ|nr:hypothetical protein E2562_000138 [Oryza meyeriana var. granulata]
MIRSTTQEISTDRILQYLDDDDSDDAGAALRMRLGEQLRLRWLLLLLLPGAGVSPNVDYPLEDAGPRLLHLDGGSTAPFTTSDWRCYLWRLTEAFTTED